MPSFTEMYYKLQGYSADPHLKPEEMQALEVGFNYQIPLFHLPSSIFQLHSTLWYHHGSNMIDWIMDLSKGEAAEWQSMNHTTINSFGIEAGVNGQWSIFNVQCNYSYIHQDKQQKAYLMSQYALEYLRHKLVAKTQMQLTKRLSLGVNLRWQDRVGSYTDFEGKVHDYEPYTLVDTKLTWAHAKWIVYIEANNLFDTNYRDYGMVIQPGRWLIAGFSIHL